MKKKFSKIIAAVLSVSFLFTLFAGCELISVDNKRDMQQVVAEVNVAEDKSALGDAFALLGAKELSLSESDLSQIASTDNLYKRDLVAYFMSYGYNYLQNGQVSYAKAVDQMMNDLVENKIVKQFAVVYYLNEGRVCVDKDNVAIEKGYVQGDKENELVMSGEPLTVDGYKAAVEKGSTPDKAAIEGLNYLLTDAEETFARYNVLSSINGAIDSYEKEVIKEETGESTETTERTLPTGANGKSNYYYPVKDGKLNYAVYTGTNSVSDCGEYEKVDGSSSFTRKRAYLRFVNALRANYLIGEGEDISDITALGYFDMELRNQLEQMLITKFSASVALYSTRRIDAEMTQGHYSELLVTQKDLDSGSFTTTMDGMSDTSFVLYSPENSVYGFVYNILLPFNANQSLTLKELQKKLNGATSAEYYAARQKSYKEVVGTDQRASWFNGAEDYSFEATEYYKKDDASRSNRLFFKDSFVGEVDDLEKMDRYAGKYSYNGKVEKDEDDKYVLTPNKIGIDSFINEMEGYIDYVVGSPVASGKYYTNKSSWNSDNGNAFYELKADAFKKANASDRSVYANTIYYKGNVAGVADVSKANNLVESEVSYKAMSAVNELMFAYSTDPGCLNKYYGYSLQADAKTSYVAEFEYAAQDAVKNGAGNYCVVATDFGWHIIYVTFTFEGNEVYNGFNAADMYKEGTFSYKFYQNYKNSTVQSFMKDSRKDILTKLNNDTVVAYHKDAYKDLSSIA